MEFFDGTKSAFSLLPSKEFVGPFLDRSEDAWVISLVILDFPDFLSLLKRRYLGDILTHTVFFSIQRNATVCIQQPTRTCQKADPLDGGTAFSPLAAEVYFSQL